MGNSFFSVRFNPLLRLEWCWYLFFFDCTFSIELNRVIYVQRRFNLPNRIHSGLTCLRVAIVRLCLRLSIDVLGNRLQWKVAILKITSLWVGYGPWVFSLFFDLRLVCNCYMGEYMLCLHNVAMCVSTRLIIFWEWRLCSSRGILR